ncbi:hypothetical protein L209DRAFT_611343 [Thermothelomyces heterothallicus CBS 203.75]
MIPLTQFSAAPYLLSTRLTARLLSVPRLLILPSITAAEKKLILWSETIMTCFVPASQTGRRPRGTSAQRAWV